jgi:hypothetical protein
VVHDLEESPDPPVEGITLDSADGRYRIELKLEGPEQAALRALLLDLMAEDPFAFSRLMEAIRWEMPSELEEAALRFRWARLADLGFPDPETAAGLYAAVRLPPAPTSSPSGELVKSGGRRVDFVQAALEGLDPVEAENAQEELRGVFNAALVADGADPGDLDAFRASAERARDTLNLGLEFLTGGDPRRAPAMVREIPFRQVFQTGFSLGLQLRHRADRLAARPRPGWTASGCSGRSRPRSSPRSARAPDAGAPGRGRRAGAIPVGSGGPAGGAGALRGEQQQALLAALLGGTEERARAAVDGLGPAWPAGYTSLLAAAVAQVLLDGTSPSRRCRPDARRSSADLSRRDRPWPSGPRRWRGPRRRSRRWSRATRRCTWPARCSSGWRTSSVRPCSLAHFRSRRRRPCPGRTGCRNDSLGCPLGVTAPGISRCWTGTSSARAPPSHIEPEPVRPAMATSWGA